jgi:hypothetical protein
MLKSCEKCRFAEKDRTAKILSSVRGDYTGMWCNKFNGYTGILTGGKPCFEPKQPEIKPCPVIKCRGHRVVSRDPDCVQFYQVQCNDGCGMTGPHGTGAMQRRVRDDRPAWYYT